MLIGQIISYPMWGPPIPSAALPLKKYGLFLLNKLKEAHKAQNLEEIDQAINELNTAFHAASQEIYNATSAGAGAGAAGDTQSGPQQGDDSDKGGDDVTDVDFEEVE